MKVGNDISFVEFTYIAKVPDDSPRPGDISCSVIASRLKALEQLERTRQELFRINRYANVTKRRQAAALQGGTFYLEYALLLEP